MRRSARWKTLGGQPVPDIASWAKSASKEGQLVQIGTDSLQTGRFTQFVTVVIIYTPTKGGRVAYLREIVPRITSLRERLFKEVWLSVDLALKMDPSLLDRVEVHIDANPAIRYPSSRYVQELVGLVVGQGFKVKVKPDAYAATHASDHICRVRGKIVLESTNDKRGPVLARRNN